jgi:hypothetical protein
MTQISRPFQIALLAMGLFAAVWFVALRGQSASTTGSGSSASAPSAQAGKATTPSTPIYHGAAPGVEGLTRAIAKAHAAVTASQKSAKQVEHESPQASSSTGAGTIGASTAGSPPAAAVTAPSTSKGSATTHTITTSVKKHATATHGAAANKVASSGSSASSGGSTKASPSMEATVERELKQGKIVAVLFWNPKGSVDVAVQRELQAVGRALGGKVAVHDARANQVGSFGSITHDIQVYQTPTILIVNKSGQTTTLTGLTDSFSIEQAIGEAQHSQSRLHSTG